MRLLIVRHGDPDYERDSLTPKGWREAALLTGRLVNTVRERTENAYFYVSPLGRAKDTASGTLKELGASAEEKDWLHEFDAPVADPVTGRRRICWDFLPEFWTADARFFDADRWMQVPIYREAGVGERAEWVWKGLDELLAAHGYCREGKLYRAEKPNRDTVILFCHFGVECVILAHLLNISPAILFHGFCALPSSVTTLYTEERREGKAYFRMNSFGDLSHLYAGGEPASFAARFCETWDSKEERHD